MDLAAVIDDGETLTVEFKRGRANDQDIYQAVVCLANREGFVAIEPNDLDCLVLNEARRIRATSASRQEHQSSWAQLDELLAAARVPRLPARSAPGRPNQASSAPRTTSPDTPKLFSSVEIYRLLTRMHHCSVSELQDQEWMSSRG